jgi:uncharacterized phage protein (TIGR01671 family)
MSREIKFRGFDNEHKKWRYGYYTKLQEGVRIFDAIIVKKVDGFTRYYIHDAKTIGQFTGLLDKQGKEIYKDDIIQWETDKLERATVLFQDGVYWTDCEEYDMIIGIDLKPEVIEIIGNKHENPELLK